MYRLYNVLTSHIKQKTVAMTKIAAQTFAGRKKSLKFVVNKVNKHEINNPKGVCHESLDAKHFLVFNRTNSNLSFVVTI